MHARVNSFVCICMAGGR